ncbi:MAG: peptidylprolyl isomerase [Caldiserica bacterium]|jgi:peptidyl-prolyl cis-trans isomerase B (cyclophilin B)|nr:peptidylprolyl isomerase [Caldisericota bacterium]MDH7562407.1 peptidylprolyl isomerase [Caldisericota bacterium]
MKKSPGIFLAVFSLIFLSLIFSGCQEPGMNPTNSPLPSSSNSSGPTPLSESQGLPVAILETEKGVIKFEMYPQDAFNTVANFIFLAKRGFYDGLTFHRVEPGFVIQGGDPNGNGTGGPGYHIKAEFNSRKHLEGTVAMARAKDPNSAGSQFYICLSPQPSLDGKYTVFGQVIEGMDVVKRIQVGDKILKVRLENADGYPEPEKLP